jgi:hypothetical protein
LISSIAKRRSVVCHDATSAMRLLKPPFCSPISTRLVDQTAPLGKVLDQFWSNRLRGPLLLSPQRRHGNLLCTPSILLATTTSRSFAACSQRVGASAGSPPGATEPRSSWQHLRGTLIVLHRHRWFLADVTGLGLIYANEDQAHRITVLFPIYPRKFRT